VGVVLVLGLSILLGIFRIVPKVRLFFGLIVIAYGLVRLIMLSAKYRKEENEQNEQKKPLT
jgi:heme A synthase